MLHLVLTLIASGLLLPFAADAQPKPDFSGTWTMDRARSESTVQSEPIGPVTLIIKQTATDLSIETKRGDRHQLVTFQLRDSPPVRGLEPSGAAPDGKQPLRAFWEGSNLVTETIRYIQGETLTAKEVRSLQGGDEMTVETIVVVQHGYSLRGSKNYSTAKDVFKKIAP